MASRYGNQDYERYGERRGQFRPGESEGRYTRPFERGEFGRFDIENEENYFGSGRQGYGEGSPGSGWAHDSETGSWRSARFDRPERRYSRGRMSGESDYGDYGYRGESSRGRYMGGMPRGRFYDESRYSGRGGRYGSSYPERERGYMGGREQYGEERGWLDKASDEVSSWFGDEEAERRREMDARWGGQHRGRGPRNYIRSDDRIKEDINDRLTDYPYIDATDIDVQVKNGEVVLSGNVESRYEKRLAEDITDDISGVKNVENRIRVESSYRQMGEGGWSYSDTAGHTESGQTARPTTGKGTTSAAGRSAMGSTTGKGATGTTSTTGTTGTSATAAKSRSASGSR